MVSQVAQDKESAAVGSSKPESYVGAMRADTLWNPAKIKYSIATFVTRADQYKQVNSSFLALGSDGPDVGFLYIDNRERNEFDAFFERNLALNVARVDCVIICHQDVLLEYEGGRELDARLSEIEVLDPKWTVFGSAGVSIGTLAISVSDPHGDDMPQRSFPAPATSVDEIVLIVKRQANIILTVGRSFSGLRLHAAEFACC